MGMFSMIEDANNKRIAELVATGLTEDEAIERLREEIEAKEDRFGDGGSEV